MTVVPIPPHKLKSKTWYYGIRCACMRMHAICEDLFAGKTDESHLHAWTRLLVPCECGTVTPTDRLSKFQTP